MLNKFTVSLAANECNKGPQPYVLAFCTPLALNTAGGYVYGQVRNPDTSREPYTNYGAVVYYGGYWRLILAAQNYDECCEGGRGINAAGDYIMSWGHVICTYSRGDKTVYYVDIPEDGRSFYQFPFPKSDIGPMTGREWYDIGNIAMGLVYGETQAGNVPDTPDSEVEQYLAVIETYLRTMIGNESNSSGISSENHGSRVEQYMTIINSHLRTLAGDEGGSSSMSEENHGSRVEEYLSEVVAHLQTIAEGGGGSSANPSGVTQQYVDSAIAEAVGAAIGGGY